MRWVTVPYFELFRVPVDDLLPEGVDEGLGVQEQRPVRQRHVALHHQQSLYNLWIRIRIHIIEKMQGDWYR